MYKYTIIICLLPFLIQAQHKKKVYLDESNQQIDHTIFTKKISSGFFDHINIETDSVSYKRIRYRSYFGTLDPQKKSQLNKLFFSRYRIDSTKVWVIHRIDSLPSPEEVRNPAAVIYLDAARTKVRHARNLENQEGLTNKEFIKWQKVKEAAFLRFYDHDNGYPVANEENPLYQDKNRILRKMFSDGFKPYSFIVLHPTGEFFVSYYLIPKEEELVDLKNFRKRREKFMRDAEIGN